MAFKYRIKNSEKYFLPLTVVDWIDVFTRKELAEDLIDACVIASNTKACTFMPGV